MFEKAIFRIQNAHHRIFNLNCVFSICHFRHLSTSNVVPERRQDFAKLTKDDFNIFQNLLGDKNVRTKDIDE